MKMITAPTALRFVAHTHSSPQFDELRVRDIDFGHPRGLSRHIVAELACCRWIDRGENVVITGPTGTGKTFLAHVLAFEARRAGYSIAFKRVARVLYELAAARACGQYLELIADLGTADVLVLDDWALTSLSNEERRDVLELLDERDGHRSTLVTSQLPPEAWADYIGDPPVAAALWDRLVRRAHIVRLKGPSMRR